MRTHTVDLEGLPINVVDSEGTGHPIVLLHGNSCGSFVYRHQLEGELGSRFRLIVVDFPGHGRSGWARESSGTGYTSDRPATEDRPAAEDRPDAEDLYTIPGYAGVVVEVVQRIGVSEAVVAGHSLGGHVALEAAPRLPGAVGFFTFGAPPVGKPAAMDRAFLPNPNIAAAFQADSPDEIVRRYITDFFTPDTPVPDEFYRSYHRTDGRIRTVLQESVAAGTYTDELDLARTLGRPLAIIHGEQDLLVNDAYYSEIELPTLWRGAVQHIAGGGHTPQWETPDEFNRLLAAFVDEVS